MQASPATAAGGRAAHADAAVHGEAAEAPRRSAHAKNSGGGELDGARPHQMDARRTRRRREPDAARRSPGHPSTPAGQTRSSRERGETGSKNKMEPEGEPPDASTEEATRSARGGGVGARGCMMPLGRTQRRR